MEEENCIHCKNFNTKECDECSKLWDRDCSCHINPPCPVCENNKFENK